MSTGDLVATVAAMGSLGTVVLDALPREQAMEVAAQLSGLDWIVDWLAGTSEASGEEATAAGEASAEEEGPGVLESIAEMVGLGTGDTDDGWALAKQTAANLKCVGERLDEASELAAGLGHGDFAADLATASASLYESELIAGGVLKVVEAKTRVDAVERLCHAALAAYKCDLADEGAAAVFDEFFAAAGAMGEIAADYSGAVGAILKPMATFVKMFGEYNLCAAVERNMGMHGGRGPNGDAVREAEAEGLL
ncbi:MAG: hypothetical protein FJ102_02455 [Deltaproteobacteria bacterium]|nr:hypothetical protein [Deltaproteobacteria bacterium]